MIKRWTMPCDIVIHTVSNFEGVHMTYACMHEHVSYFFQWCLQVYIVRLLRSGTKYGVYKGFPC